MIWQYLESGWGAFKVHCLPSAFLHSLLCFNDNVLSYIITASKLPWTIMWLWYYFIILAIFSLVPQLQCCPTWAINNKQKCEGNWEFWHELSCKYISECSLISLLASMHTIRLLDIIKIVLMKLLSAAMKIRGG